MGLIFTNIVPTKVAAKMATLIQNRQGLVVIDEKLSPFIKRSVAAASNPTTAGRNPSNILCTMGELTYLRNILLMRIIKTSDGNTNANVAITEPRTAIMPV